MNVVSRVTATAALAAAVLAGASPLAIADPVGTETVASAADIKPALLTRSPAEEAEWQQLTATEAGRQKVVTELRSAFAGAGQVGVPAAAPSGGKQTDLATGITGDHFWITISYADVVNGAVAVAVRACQTRLPGWLCSTAGNLLTSWAAGWGSAGNHGLWAAIYWAPPHVEGGRW